MVTTTKNSEFDLINFFRFKIWFFCRKRHPNRSKIDGGVVILVRGIKKKGGENPLYLQFDPQLRVFSSVVGKFWARILKEQGRYIKTYTIFLVVSKHTKKIGNPQNDLLRVFGLRLTKIANPPSIFNQFCSDKLFINQILILLLPAILLIPIRVQLYHTRSKRSVLSVFGVETR